MITSFGIGPKRSRRRSRYSAPNGSPSLLTAVVENTEPTHVVLTFQSAKELDENDLTITGFTVSSVSWVGAIMTAELTESVVYGDVVIITILETGQSITATNNVAMEAELATYISGLSTPLSLGQLIIINNTIISYKVGQSVSSIAEDLDVWRIYGNETSESSLKNMAKNAHHGTLQGTPNPAFTALKGFLSDGLNGYINGNYNPNSDGSTYTQNSSLLMVYSHNDLISNNIDAGCNNSGATRRATITIYSATELTQARINTAVYDGTGLLVTSNSKGMFAGSREAQASLYAYHDESRGAQNTVNSVAIPDFTAYELAANNAGTPGNYSVHQLGMLMWGRGRDQSKMINLSYSIKNYWSGVLLKQLNELSITNLYTNNISKKLNKAIRHNFATAIHGYFSRLYFYNGKYYLTWMAQDNIVEKISAYACTFKDNRFSQSYVTIEGTAGEQESHGLSSIIVDDNGYIYTSRSHGDFSNELYVAKSDNPEDISSFTTIQTLTFHYHDYARFQKIGTDIFLIGRSTLENYSISKKSLSDAMFSSPATVIKIHSVAEGLAYAFSLRNEDENKIGIACQYIDPNGNRTEPRMGYIETLDGVTFSNAQGTFSKNIAIDGFITEAEFVANCILYDPVDTLDHNMCTDGFFLNGVPYLLVEEGHNSTIALDTNVDFTALKIRYFSGGTWQDVTFAASGMPFTRQFSEPTRFHFTHDGVKFIMFIYDSTFQKLHNYSSLDLVTWTDNGEIMDVSVLGDRKLAYSGSCQNRFDLMQMGYYEIDHGGDLLAYKY